MRGAGRLAFARWGAAAGKPARVRRRDVGFAVTVAAGLAAYNNVAGGQAWHQRWDPAVNAGAAAALLASAAASGLTAADLGLARDRLLPGLRLGAGFAAAAGAGWLVTALVPAARPVLHDQRISTDSGRAVAYQALVRIPVGTVLWEEAAFRGVLQAALCRVLPRPAAITVTCVIFGAWHIRPTAEALRMNGLARGRGATAAAVIAGAAVTAAGGVVLSLLRERSGSLAAPVLVHLATNSPGPVAAWVLRTMG